MPARMTATRRGRIFIVAVAVAAIGGATGIAYAAIAQVDPASVPNGFLVANSNVHGKVSIRVDRGHRVRLDGLNVYVQKAVIPPGGSTGWHSHAGPIVVTMVEGSLTYVAATEANGRSGAHGCPHHVYEAGRGFVDPGFGFVHTAINEGTTPAVFYATYLLPRGSGDAGVKQPMPDYVDPGCPSIH